MFNIINFIFLSGVIFALSESFSIGEIIEKKCGGYDNDCQKGIFHKVWAVLADKGIQDLGMPRIDPYKIKNMEINALGLVNIWIKEGTVEGLKSCYSSSFKNSKKTLAAEIELTCPYIKIIANYKVKSTPILLRLIGDNMQIRGEGTASLVAEKVKINLVLPYIIKRVNGELYYHLKSNEITSDMQVLGKATLAADNISIGKQEISAIVANAFNGNWDFMVKSFAKIALDKVVEVIYEIATKFFNGVPISDMCTDDLSSYVTN